MPPPQGERLYLMKYGMLCFKEYSKGRQGLRPAVIRGAIQGMTGTDRTFRVAENTFLHATKWRLCCAMISPASAAFPTTKTPVRTAWRDKTALHEMPKWKVTVPSVMTPEKGLKSKPFGRDALRTKSGVLLSERVTHLPCRLSGNSAGFQAGRGSKSARSILEQMGLRWRMGPGFRPWVGAPRGGSCLPAPCWRQGGRRG